MIGVEYFPITDNADAADAGYVQLGANDGAVFDLFRRSLSAECSRELSLASFMWVHRSTFRVKIISLHHLCMYRYLHPWYRDATPFALAQCPGVAFGSRFRV